MRQHTDTTDHDVLLQGACPDCGEYHRGHGDPERCFPLWDFGTSAVTGEPLPRPVKILSLICYGVQWYATEDEAQAAHDHVRATGQRINGGFFDGVRCGRDRNRDHVDHLTGEKIYAVTTS